MIVSKTIETFIEKSRRFIKLLRFGESDTMNVTMFSQFGDDFNVPKGYDTLYVKTSNSNDPVCIGFVNKVVFDSLNSGDKEIFSTNSDGDTIAAFIKLLNTGVIHINGDADNIAGYAKLKEGFDTLKQDFNNLVTAYNTHIHITTATVGATPTPGVIAPTTSTGTSSSASIDSSKKENVKIE